MMQPSNDQHEAPHLDTATIRALAVKYGVDPRSIRALHKGRAVRGMAGHRCAEALAEWRRSVGLDVAQGR